MQVHVELEGTSLEEIEKQIARYLKRFPNKTYGTYFHHPRYHNPYKWTCEGYRSNKK